MTSISPDVMSRVAAYEPDVVILSVAGSDLHKRYANPGAVAASLQMLMIELLALESGNLRFVGKCVTESGETFLTPWAVLEYSRLTSR